MAKKKEVTIEDLAGMVKRGFDGVDERFDDVDKRFGDVDKRFGDVDKRFGDVDKRFDGVYKRFDKMQLDMDGQFAEVNDRLDTLQKLVLAQHKHRIERLEVEVKNLKDLFALK